ncbi:hypothetical protein BDF14DRAFT_1833810 [Spinellus fusiger]|nr:hypothetical protein BDF14DRAFT_1833757 [Spinellus fusiger]KAI7864490.1 hypothetical protein BDF14DRAFT_1833810 [Spinellus fusiger]
MPLVMNLASIKHTPPQSIASQNTHSRWRRGIALLTRWSQSSHRKPSSSSHSSSYALSEKHLTDTIQCEDLTAKEFAQLTGIKIRSTESEEEEDTAYEGYYATVPAFMKMASDPQSPPPPQHLNVSQCQLSTHSSRSAQSSESRGRQNLLRIWDSDYWQYSPHYHASTPTLGHLTSSLSTQIYPTKSRSDPVQPIPIHSSLCSEDSALSSVASMCSVRSSSGSTAATSYASDTPFLSHLRRQSTHDTSSQPQRPTNVIQKGRFKIVLGYNDGAGDAPVITLPEQVVEWKRKRADVCSGAHE